MQRTSATICLVAGLMLAACGGLPAEDAGFDASALELDMGGIEMTDEQPSFGDPDTSWYAEDRVIAGPGEESIKTVRFLVVRERPMSSAPTESTWSGRVVAQGASVRVLRTVRFDGEESPAQNDEGGRSFASTTLPHHDGVIVQVAIPDGTQGPVLEFGGAVNGTLTAEEISALSDPIERTQADGGTVLIYAMPQSPCPSGYLAGRWKRVNERGGVFRGRWARDDGAVTGHVKGIWGRRLSGEKVFFGKVINHSGRLLGVIHGTYSDHDFRGVYSTARGQVDGALRGRARGDGRGIFHARWTRTCGADSSGN